jgi:NifU-like protein involved in Fe-S cluster formation
MSSDPYSAEVRSLFAAAEHGGVLDDALCAVVEDQGVRISLFATVEEGIVTGLRFQAWGCPHVIAAAEAFCAEFEGHAASDLLEFSVSGLMQSLSVPVEKSGRILVLEDAVRSLGSIVRGTSRY